MSTTPEPSGSSQMATPEVIWRYQLTADGEWKTLTKGAALEPNADTYWLAASSTSGNERKKEDLLGSKWVMADKDPPLSVWTPTRPAVKAKPPTETEPAVEARPAIPGHETSPGALDAWRAEERAALEAYEPRLTLIVDSGRGYQFGYELDHVVPVPVIEALRYDLMLKTDADNCWDASHVYRLWGTPNSKTGRTAELVRYEPELVYKPTALPATTPPAKVDAHASTAAVDRETGLDAYLDETADALVRYVIKHDRKPPHEPRQFGSRSEALFFVVNELVRKGVPEGVILGTLLRSNSSDEDEAGICHSIYWWKNKSRLSRRRNPEAYARKQVGGALGRQAAEHALKASGSNDNEPFHNEALNKKLVEKDPPKQREAQVLELEDLGDVPEFLSDRPWLVPGILLKSAITMLQGKGGEGKSNWALDLGASCAMGIDTLGFMPLERVKVLVLNAEDDKEEMQRRLRALELHLGIKVPKGWLTTKSLTRRQFAMVERSADGGIQETDTFRDIKLTIQHHGIGLIIVDPWIQATRGLEENDNNDMMDGLGLLADFARAQGIPLLGVHHNRKGSATQGDGDQARGASAIRDAARIQLLLETMTKEFWDKTLKAAYGNGDIGKHTEYVRLDVGKSNYGERLTDIWYRKRLYVVTQPRGDKAVAFERVTFGAVPDEAYTQGVDSPQWQQVRSIIAQGRGDNRLWSRAHRGRKVEHLTHLIQSQLGVDEVAAKDLIRLWVRSGMLVEGMQEGTRGNKPVQVYALPGDERLMQDTQGGLEL